MEKVTLYLVKGRGTCDGYIESVRVLEDMEEKAKTFVGLGKRVDKSKIGKVVQEGTFYGSFEMYVLNQEDINVARKLIKDKVITYHTDIFTKTQQTLEKLSEHDLNSKIEFREF
jgi:hypothetical protein